MYRMKFEQSACTFRISQESQWRQHRRYIAVALPQPYEPGLMISQFLPPVLAVMLEKILGFRTHNETYIKQKHVSITQTLVFFVDLIDCVFSV